MRIGKTNHSTLDPQDARTKLQSATRLHSVHWLVIALSFVLSIVAWRYAKSSLDARQASRFDREADQVTALIRHRMKNYEDALWSGVGMIRASGGDVDFDQWQTYADSIDIPGKYPGINGLGVIHHVRPGQMKSYVQRQRQQRPDFRVHPKVESPDRFPISYIVPVHGNEKAVGLDVAHEKHRRRAAQQAADTGTAQISGPITLVQDDARTPGFLFYAPFYQTSDQPFVDPNQSVAGLVYAPFIVKKLMQGVLERDMRHVGIRIADEGQVLYDEHTSDNPDFDASPLFTRQEEIQLYGRTWKFDIRSGVSFRDSAHSSQPTLILIGGIAIECLLILMFVSMSRSSKTALNYADSMTHQLEASQRLLKDRAKQLEQSNEKLEQFAFIASHDLQEPLRKVASFCNLIGEEYGARLDETGHQYLNYAIDGANRMRSLVKDLLKYSKLDNESRSLASVDAEAAFRQAASNIEFLVSQSNAAITSTGLPQVNAHEPELIRLFQNLIGNSIKYRSELRPKIRVSAIERPDCWRFSVEDNGIGISPEYREQVFGVFKRLQSRSKSSGNGIGLAICKRIVEGWQGKIWVAGNDGRGCTVWFTIPKSLKTNADIDFSEGAKHGQLATNFA